MQRTTLKPTSQLPEHWQVWYREWDSRIPDNENKRRLQGDLFSKPGSQQSYSAAFELFLFSTFNNMGLNVDFQPVIGNVNPDYRISDKRGCGAYVEAGVMFSDPVEAEMSYISMGMPIWEEFNNLVSLELIVKHASSSGHPGNVSPRLVRREVQKWIDQLDLAEVCMKHYYNNLPHRTFQFNNWRLEVKMDLKSSEDKERLGEIAVDLAGFSGGWSDDPVRRLKSKLEEKSSQVRKTKGHCVVAVTGRMEGFSADEVQTTLFGGNSEYDLSPYVKDLSIPQPNTDGIWSSHGAKEPIAVIIHRGNLQYPDDGETEIWLNPNSSYFRIPLPLYGLKVYSLIQKIWTKPATRL